MGMSPSPKPAIDRPTVPLPPSTTCSVSSLPPCVPAMEHPSRAKKTTLFGVLGRKGPSKGLTDRRNQSNGQAQASDPVQAMQDRMLHSALHNRSAYQPAQLVARTHVHSSVKPPRGTLSDDKLPYLDWRLSTLLLQQVQSDERQRSERETMQGVACELQEQQSASSMRSDSHASWDRHANDFGVRMIVPGGPGQQDGGVEMNDVMLAKTALRNALLINDALAAVPLLERESRYLATGEGDTDDDDEASNEIFSEEGSDPSDCIARLPAPLPAPSLPGPPLDRHSFGLGSSAMERSDASPTSPRKLTSLFARASSRPSLTSRRSVSLAKASNERALSEVTVNNLFYDATECKPKKKWSLLALPSLAGSGIAYESELMR